MGRVSTASGPLAIGLKYSFAPPLPAIMTRMNRHTAPHAPRPWPATGTPPPQTWFLHLDLQEVKTGVEVAGLLRARLWTQTLGQTARILTSAPNGVLQHEVARLRACGEVAWPLEVACLYDVVQRPGGAPGDSASPAVTAPTPTAAAEPPAPPGAVAWHDTHLADGTLVSRAHVDASGQALRRDGWDVRGFWSHLQTLDAEGHCVQAHWLDEQGRAVLRKCFAFEQERLWCKEVWRLDPATGEPVQAFASERDFLFWALAQWLDPALPHVLLVDQTLRYLGLAASPWLAKHRIRVVAMVHNTHEMPGRRGRVANTFTRGLLDGSEAVDDVVVLTQAQARDVAATLQALPKPPRLWVIGHPAFDTADSTAPAVRTAQPSAPGPVVCMARFAAQKNHLGLLWVCEAVRRETPDVRFDFYGEGPLKDAVQAQLTVLGLQDQVRLHGFCSEPARVYASASMAVLGSRFEGFSLFCLEALAHGLPVVAFDVDYGPAELIEHGVNGFLLTPGDTAGFAQAVLRLWKDAGLRARMSAAARASARRFAPEALADRWRELLSCEGNQPMVQGDWPQESAARALDEGLAFVAKADGVDL